MKEEIFDIGGMHCASCSSAIERVTRKLPGVERSEVNLPMNRLNIVYDEDKTTPQMIISKIEKAGFIASQRAQGENIKPSDSAAEGEGELKREKISLIISVCLSAILLYVSMGTMLFKGTLLPDIFSMETHGVNFAILQMLLTIPVLFLNRHYFVGGFAALIHGSPNMDTLVAISAAASFIYSTITTFIISDNPHAVHNLYFETAAVVVALVSVGKYLEAKNKEKTKESIKKLMELTPETAILVDENGQWEVPTAMVKVGDTVLVKGGARVPLDGEVQKGSASVNEAMLTGESLPIDKAEGDEVTGGSICISGALFVKVTRIGDDTTVSKIIKFVEDAQGKKAPISKTADKVAGVFVPAVIAVAILSAVVWLISGAQVPFVLKIFTSILVIACPCAMGLATPTAIIVGTGIGASNGILIRNGEALETTHKVTVAIFDKTGTVTKGTPMVTDIEAVGSEDELLSLAAGAEKFSAHPLAKAICEEFDKKELKTDFEIADYQDHIGAGITASISDGSNLAVGNKKLMAESGVDISAFISKAESLQAQGKTVIFVAKDKALFGFIAIGDEIKDDAPKALSKLRAIGVKTILLTGDNKAAAQRIGEQVGAEEIVAEVLPTQKAQVVKSYQDKGEIVMMVGDGINDAPALTQADIGCAIGNGSDIAIDCAQIVLMKNELSDVHRAIRLSRLTISNIKQNLFWAFCYNTMGIPIAAGVLYPAFHILLSPMIGGLAMSLSSLFVVGNALRLKGKKI